MKIRLDLVDIKQIVADTFEAQPEDVEVEFTDKDGKPLENVSVQVEISGVSW